MAQVVYVVAYFMGWDRTLTISVEGDLPSAKKSAEAEFFALGALKERPHDEYLIVDAWELGSKDPFAFYKLTRQGWEDHE